MNSKLVHALATLAAIALESPPARADGSRPAVKPGAVEARLVFELALNEDNANDPISLSPDLRYGVIDGLDVGLIHSTEAVTGFAGFQNGSSLCLSGQLCDSLGLYHNLGVEGRYLARDGRTWRLAGTAAVLANQLDPLTVAVKLGGASWWTAGWLRLGLDPYVQIAATDRDTALDVAAIPIGVGFGPARLRAAVQTGVFSSLDGQVLDNIHVPLSLEIQSELSASIAAGVGFALPGLYGGKAVRRTGFEARTISLWVRFTSPVLLP